MPATAEVIVSSTRAAAGEYEDASGPIAEAFLQRMGFTVTRHVVPDAAIGAAVRAALARRPRVLITSGGTGITADDRTVEAVAPLLNQELPGIVHAFYQRGIASTDTAILSRAVAGMAGETFVFTLPGSPGGVKDGCAVLEPILPHLLELAPAAPPQPGLVIGVTVTDEPLEAPTVTDDTCGALVTFDGIVRNHDHGEAVAALAYEAHPSAETELARVCEEIAAAYPVRMWVGHRTGDVPIGETAFLVAVAAAHRAEAFAACQLITDRVKAEVPIWKHQTLTDGTAEWVGIDG